MTQNRISTFLKSAGAILLVSALARFLIAAGHGPLLSRPDPVLGFSLRYAVLLVGGFEFLVALICLFGRQVYFQIGWLAWLMTNFLVFQTGCYWMRCHPQATCIGSLTDPLQLARGGMGGLAIGVLVYLVVGSYTALIWLWINGAADRAASQSANSIKMACPACGSHIKFAAQNLGRKIPCPHCHTIISLRKPDRLKMACFFCQEHIEFPAHAIGEKLPCPHCNMDITLKEAA